MSTAVKMSPGMPQHSLPRSVPRHLGQEIPPDRQGRHADRPHHGRHVQACRPRARRRREEEVREHCTSSSCGRCAGARSGRPHHLDAGAQEHKRPRPRSTARCPAPSATRWTTSCASPRGGLTLKAGCGIGYEFSTLRRAARTCRARAPTPRARCRSWTSTTRCASRCRRRAAVAARRWHVRRRPPGRHGVHPRQARGRAPAPVHLSLLVTDEFMKAVREDRDWRLAFR